MSQRRRTGLAAFSKTMIFVFARGSLPSLRSTSVKRTSRKGLDPQGLDRRLSICSHHSQLYWCFFAFLSDSSTPSISNLWAATFWVPMKVPQLFQNSNHATPISSWELSYPLDPLNSPQYCRKSQSFWYDCLILLNETYLGKIKGLQSHQMALPDSSRPTRRAVSAAYL